MYEQRVGKPNPYEDDAFGQSSQLSGCDEISTELNDAVMERSSDGLAEEFTTTQG